MQILTDFNVSGKSLPDARPSDQIYYNAWDNKRTTAGVPGVIDGSASNNKQYVFSIPGNLNWFRRVTECYDQTSYSVPA